MNHRKRVSDAVIIESYGRLRNVWHVGKEVGLCGQSVHERCTKLGIIPPKAYQKWQIDFIKKHYNYYADRYRLNELSELLLIGKSSLVKLAKSQGIQTSYCRKLVDAKHRKMLYTVFMTMKARCENPNCKQYKNYGGRGISIEFTSLDDFIENMAAAYEKGLTIERVDVNGNYSKSNCKWANIKEQANNKRATSMVTINEQQVKLNLEAQRLGFKTDTIRKRFKRGWSVEKALTTPITHNT
jgi:hypothetical protein